MKIGYPCINWGLGYRSNHTFRLKSYSEERLIETIRSNLDGLLATLKFNQTYDLLFFRISSDIIPFASHPINTFNWLNYFRADLKKIGDFIKHNNMRISMHPSQFVLINSMNDSIIKKSIADLEWHCQFLDALHLDHSAKVQIHVGGVYNDKLAATKRFINNYQQLPDNILKRLVIENDDRLFSLSDCMQIHSDTAIPILFDTYHHECLNQGESLNEALLQAMSTWQKRDGLLMVDYSTCFPNGPKGKHTDHIDISHFTRFIQATSQHDFDIMLEIKDKEKSALIAKEVLRSVRD